MKKRLGLIIWIVAICAVLSTAYIFYSKNSQKTNETVLQDNTAESTSQQTITEESTSQQTEAAVSTSQQTTTAENTSEQTKTAENTSEQTKTAIITSQQTKTATKTSQQTKTATSTSKQTKTAVTTSEQTKTAVTTSEQTKVAAATTEQTKTAESTSEQTKTAESTLQEAKEFAKDFALKDLNGQVHKLSDYKGKIVIMVFWEVRCSYCRKEIPLLNALNKGLEGQNDVVILPICSAETNETVQKYLSDNDITLNVLLDTDAAVYYDYGTKVIPNNYILNKDGSVYSHIIGPISTGQILTAIDTIRKQ